VQPLYTVTHKEENIVAISKDSVRVATILSKEVAQKIEELAKLEKRSVSAMTAILIEKALESYKK